MLGGILIDQHPAIALLVQVVNFAILLAIIVKFAKKPFKEFLKKRHDTVKERLDEAERLLKEVAELKAHYVEKLSRLPEEIEAFRASALREAEAERTKILGEANELALRIKEQARLAYEQEMKEALSQVRAKIADRTIKAAEVAVRQRFTKEDHDRMVEAFIRNVRSVT